MDDVANHCIGTPFLYAWFSLSQPDTRELTGAGDRYCNLGEVSRKQLGERRGEEGKKEGDISVAKYGGRKINAQAAWQSTMNMTCSWSANAMVCHHDTDDSVM